MPDAALSRLIRPGNLCSNRRSDKAFTPHPTSGTHCRMRRLARNRWQLLPAHLTSRIAHQFHFTELTGHRIVHNDFSAGRFAITGQQFNRFHCL